MPLHAVTASRLRDGVILWLTAGNAWSPHFAEAAAFEDGDLPAALATGQRSVQAQQVIGVYQVAVSRTAAGLRPDSVRETIRATGPSVRPDLLHTGA